MSRLIEKAVNHYKDLTSEPRKILVPEWSEDGEDPVVIYATPLTLSERQRLQRDSRDDLELASHILLLKAKDANGEPYFKQEERLQLMKSVDSSIVAKIAARIIGTASDGERIEEFEGN